MEVLKCFEDRLRQAVISENFDDVRIAAAAYRQAFDRHWQGMPLEERRRSLLPRKAAQLMDWARCLLTISRTALAERRRASGAAGRYLQTGRHRQTHTWGSAG